MNQPASQPRNSRKDGSGAPKRRSAPPSPPKNPPRRPLPGGAPEEANRRKNLVAWLGVGLLALLMLSTVKNPVSGANLKEWDQKTFWASVDKGEIQKTTLVREDSTVSYLTGPLPGNSQTAYRVNVIPSAELENKLSQHGVALTIEYQNDLMKTLLPNLILGGLMFIGLLFIFRMIRNSQASALAFGKSRAKTLTPDKRRITFKDVAGIKEAKEEVAEMVAFLKTPDKFKTLGARIPKGVLLMGPPGTGKTLLAKAIAGEAGVPFFSISGSDFIEMFVGIGATRVRDMFEQARKNAPCIIFIDEIDAIGRSRFTGIGGGHDEREQTLNAMLVEMDGFSSDSGVIVMAATNRADVLDPALTRPGRFDRQIVIDLPTIDGRLEILKLHARKVKLAKSADLTRIARGTPGFSGADLANLLNEAALIAARGSHNAILHSDLEEARDKVLWGRERRSRAMEDRDRRITAWHESGHALAQVLCEHTDPVHKVTIIPRGQALGATMSLPERDVLNRTRAEFLDNLVVLTAGRIAEHLYTNDISTGAAADIQMATRIAQRMVCTYGMSDRIGFRSYGDNQELLFLGREVQRSNEHSEATSRLIDEEIDRLLKEAFDRATTLINANRETLERLVEELLRQETLDGRAVEDLVKLGHIRTEKERQAESPSEEV
ncbi:MAG: ATP-dependent zinc metalloprotease FtsH [Kiritimatiellia bacterium]